MPCFFARCKINEDLLFDAISATFACVQLEKYSNIFSALDPEPEPKIAMFFN